MNAVTCKVSLPNGGPLHVDTARVAEIALRLGVPPISQLALEVVLRHPTGKEQGFTGGTVQVDPSTWRIEVYVQPRATYSEKSIYRLNNTLVHELRHIAQDIFELTGKGVEAEARVFGRLAHLPEFCAIYEVVSAVEEASVLWVCDVCGPVELLDVIDDAMGTEAVYLHDEPDCPGSVEPTIVSPEVDT